MFYLSAFIVVGNKWMWCMPLKVF